MAEKIIILNVDLSCSLCCRKMKKVLNRYQDQWNIKKVNWDDKNNKITLCGPFNPDALIKKLCCRACKTIKEITIPDPPPPKPAPKPEKKPDKPPEKNPEPATEKKPAPPPPEPEKKPAPPPPEPEKKPAPPPPEPEKKPAPPPPEPEKKPAPPPPEPEKKPAPPPPAPIPPQYPMLYMTGQICFCGPCHEKQRSCNCDCSHGHRPCACDAYGGGGYGYNGYGYGWNHPPPVYGRPNCQLFCEEDAGGCTVM